MQRAKAVEERVARQRAADKAPNAARLAFSGPTSSPISSRSSGGGWFSKVSQATAASGQTHEPRSPWGPAATSSSDLFSRLQIKNIPSPNAELGPRNSSAMRKSTSNLLPDTLSPSSATAGSAARSSAESEEQRNEIQACVVPQNACRQTRELRGQSGSGSDDWSGWS